MMNYEWRKSGGIRDVKTDKMIHYTMTKPDDGDAVFEIEGGPAFTVPEMAHHFDWPYTIRRPDEGFKPLDSFTEEQKRLLYPFALVLACLDGNAFVNHENPEFDLVLQYIPSVFAVLDQNRCVELTENGAKFRSDRI
jgi:hypothetical protein